MEPALASGRCQHQPSEWAVAHLHHDVPQLSLYLLLGARKALEQVVAHAALLQKRRTRLLCAADLDDALDVLDGAADERGAQNALRNLGRLLLAGLGLLVKQRQVDVLLEVLAEPRLEIGLLRCCVCRVSLCIPMHRTTYALIRATTYRPCASYTRSRK